MSDGVKNHPSISSAFVGYNQRDQFEDIVSMYGHTHDRYYRRHAFRTLFDKSDVACIFSIRKRILKHMMSLTASDDELLSYTDAYAFAMEYAHSQLQENESAVTIECVCNQYGNANAIPIIERYYTKYFSCFETPKNNQKRPQSLFVGTYFPVDNGTMISSLAKNPKCHGFLKYILRDVCIEAVVAVMGKLVIIIDNLLLSMFDSGCAFTKETIMFEIDSVLGHERYHKFLDTPKGPWSYLSEHWKAAFNLTEFPAIEQACNRAGLIYAIKQKHRRNRLNGGTSSV